MTWRQAPSGAIPTAGVDSCAQHQRPLTKQECSVPWAWPRTKQEEGTAGQEARRRRGAANLLRD
eukprot:9992010-Alexandrium_andersonii.AAC.1